MSKIAHLEGLRFSYCVIVNKISLTLLTMFCALSINAYGSVADEVNYADFPFVIYCEIGGIHHAFYLSKISQDRVAVYVSQAGQAGTITLTGTPQQVGKDNSGSCAGQTLEQLRAAGKAFYLQR